MIKRILLIIFLIYGSVGLQAAYTDNDTIARYYNYIYNAEHNIISGNTDAAAEYYNKAFNTGFKAFATDIYNNAVCAVLNKDYRTALDMCELLVLKGADMPYFDTTDIFHDFNKSKEYRLLSNSYDSLKQIRLKTINTDLISLVNAFSQRDQAIHCFLPQNDKDRRFVDSMHRIDDSLNQSLRMLMLDNDYLSEDIIGANFQNGFLALSPVYGTLVFHQFQKDGKLMSDVIDAAITKGKLRAETGLEWIQNCSCIPHIIFTGDYHVINDTLWLFNMPNEIQTKLVWRLLKYTDTNTQNLQKKYYMDTPANVISKIVYNYQHRNSIPEKEANFIISIGLIYSNKSEDTDSMRDYLFVSYSE